jgi:hypothetical protein
MERIEIITSKDFEEHELSEIKALFEGMSSQVSIDNKRMIGKSLEEQLPSAIWAFVYFAAGAVFSGFFGQAGSDSYNKLKETIKKLSSGKRRGKPIQVRIHLRQSGSNDVIVPIPDDPLELEPALDSLPKFIEANPNLNGWIFFQSGSWKKFSDLH